MSERDDAINAGRKVATTRNVCLHIPHGASTCGRILKKGKCPKHGEDIYTPLNNILGGRTG